jgi:putative ABC transport system permease protein
MILWKFTFREIKNRPGRATLTLLSIVIGVAAVVAVTVGSATTRQAFKDMYVAVSGRAALEVAAEGNGAFEEDVAAEIEKVPGVKCAVPSVQTLSIIHFQKSRPKLMVLGIDASRDDAVRDYGLEKGEFFKKKYEALLEIGFARGLGIDVGDDVKLGVLRGLSGGMKSFRITGLLSPRGAAGFSQGGIIFLPLKTAQSLFCKPGCVNNISIVLNDGVDEKVAAEAIRKILPAGLNVHSPMMRSQLSQEMIQNVNKGLDLAYVSMLALAFFTILNTFLMNVGERRRQLAVLRAIGATRRQMIRALLMEGLAMGVAGTILGSLIGLGGAYVLAQSMGRVYSAPVPTLCITPDPFILAAILGPSVSLFAMFVPAWIAGKVSPLEGMRFVTSEGRRGISWTYALMSFAVFGVTASVMAACIKGYLPAGIMVVVGVIFTASFILIIPMLLGILAKLVTFVLYPILRVEGQIAHRQILRRRARTTLTIGILYIAVSTAVSLGSNILDNVQDIHTWMTKTLKGDFFVRALTQDLATGMSPKMPESLVNDIHAIDGVANIDSVRYITGSVRLDDVEGGKQQVVVLVRDFTDRGNLPLDIQSGGSPAQIRQRLAEGEVVLGTVLAHRMHDVKAGENITLETREGPKQLRVAGTTTAYMVNGLVIYMEGKIARKLLNVEGVDMYVVTAKPGALAAVEAKLKPLCEDGGLMLHSFADLRRHVDDLTTGVIASLWGLLVLGLIVGAFGIANTLTMNVLEQTRELALLRVVAMTRRQVRKTILAQAIIIGFIGLVIGIVGGVIGSYVTNLSSLQLLGHAPAFAFHPMLLLVCFGIGAVVILAAAWLPAERAARLRLLIALQYE